MSIRTIPAGTRIYLTKKHAPVLSVQPGKLLLNDSLYVLYDVRINGIIVIPRGTRVTGDWVTEITPQIAVQLQITRVHLSGVGQPLIADSEVSTCLSGYSRAEVCNTPFLYNTSRHRGRSNLKRRIAKIHNRTRTLADSKPDTIYLDIDTTEIPVTLIEDFVYEECPTENDSRRLRSLQCRD